MQGALEAEPVAAQLPELAAFHACDAAAGQVKKSEPEQRNNVIPRVEQLNSKVSFKR